MKPQIWPVIHVDNLEDTLEDVQLVQDSGCDGVFLISMKGEDEELKLIAGAVRTQFPEFRIGINMLSTDALNGLQVAAGLDLDAVWSDCPGVNSQGTNTIAMEVGRFISETATPIFFGSVAFKYQPHEPEPAVAAAIAHGLGMIPTTSGEGTGKPPSAEKLKAMRAAGRPLAVASGISSENVLELGKYVTHILIASSINTNDRLDKAKLCEFMAVVNTHLW